MRPGLWWWHCCRAQRLSGVQRLSRSTGGLYSHPTPNLSWDQVFLFNKAPSISQLSSLRFFFLLLLFFQKAQLVSALCQRNQIINPALFSSSFVLGQIHVWVLWPKSISLHDWQLVHILSVWLWLDFSFCAKEISGKHLYYLWLGATVPSSADQAVLQLIHWPLHGGIFCPNNKRTCMIVIESFVTVVWSVIQIFYFDIFLLTSSTTTIVTCRTVTKSISIRLLLDQSCFGSPYYSGCESSKHCNFRKHMQIHKTQAD